MYSDEQPSYEGEFYCDQHWKEFLDTASAEFVEDYIALHEKEYYERWYTSVLLTDRERLEALKLFYQLKRSEYVDELTLDRMEFFKESSDFLEFMKGKLKIR